MLEKKEAATTRSRGNQSINKSMDRCDRRTRRQPKSEQSSSDKEAQNKATNRRIDAMPHLARWGAALHRQVRPGRDGARHLAQRHRSDGRREIGAAQGRATTKTEQGAKETTKEGWRERTGGQDAVKHALAETQATRQQEVL